MKRKDFKLLVENWNNFLLNEVYEDKSRYVSQIKDLLLRAGITVIGVEGSDEFFVKYKHVETGEDKQEQCPIKGLNKCFEDNINPEQCADFLLDWIRSKGGRVGKLKKKRISRREYIRGSQGEINWTATAELIGLPADASIEEIDRYTID